MNKLRLIAGIIFFGSLWGFSEVIIGSAINEAGLPSGAIMTGLFAMTFLVISRMFYRQPGMQLGMGLVAGTLRMFNPFVGCHLCSAIAIIAEGAIFEIIWYKISPNFKELKDVITQGGMGIITAYTIFISGYIITQIITPIVAGATFYIENLIVFMPKILAGGLLPAVLGGIVLPMILVVKEVDFTVKDRLYYPITIVITILCWFVVAGNWILFS
jgi:hypothetical protein